MFNERWLELVSPRVGLIRQLAPQVRGGDEPMPPYLYTATLAHFDFKAVERSERIGAGKGETEREAMASAIGEAVERYCAYHWDPSRTFVSRIGELDAPAISPAECVLYSARQYTSRGWRYAAWRETQETTWIHATELPSGLTICVPASLVYLMYPAPRPEDFFAPASSNGLAAGPTRSAAILSGLCELMERDAMLIAWMNRLPAVELDLERSGPVAARLRQHYAHFSIELRAFVLRSDLPAAVVMALCLDPDPTRPAQVVGMGCHPDPRIALRKALFELCQGRPAEGKRFADKPPRGRLSRYEDVKTLDDHSAYASLPEHRDEFDFLWASGRRMQLEELPNPSRGDPDLDLDRCARALAGNGHRVAFVDLTLPDVADYEIHVVRTLVTDLQPIHFGHGLERLGGRRLFELPAKLGLAAGPRTEADLNPCPHPLA